MTTSRKDHDQTAPTNQHQADQAYASQASAGQNPAIDLAGFDPDRLSAAPSGLRKWTMLIDDAQPSVGEDTAHHELLQPSEEILDRTTFDALLACIASEGLEQDEAGAEEKTEADEQSQVARIQALNDAFRKTLTGGTIHLTSGIIALGARAQAAILTLVRTFDAFSNDNDPFGEHDFGAFEFGPDTIFWKIDYYDPSLTYGSDNPAEPAKTTRVLTIMLASEY